MIKRHSRRNQLFPRLELVPEVNRGEERLAAEVAVAMWQGHSLPSEIVHRASRTMTILARQ